ncbi:MAG TPA: lamin tail domain-containing protein [Phycisphaerae bacterium]|nr:lamin tail domain-containing protein [Phycisphaerae bacterium]
MSRQFRTLIALAVLAVGGAIGTARGDVVINEVYGGGGNSGAPLKSDFIELYNNGSGSVDLTGYKVSYASSSGTFNSSTTLSGSIAANSFYLIQEHTGTTGSDIPTPNATGGIDMSATKGAVELLDASANVLDLVGFGAVTSTNYETSPAPAGDNSDSVQRVLDGVDTNNNSTDFVSGAPTPGATNAASPVPEPASLAFLAAGGLALVARRRRI